MAPTSDELQRAVTARLGLESCLTCAIAFAQLAGPSFHRTMDQLLSMKRAVVAVRLEAEEAHALSTNQVSR